MAYENLKSTGIKYVLTKLKDYFLQIKDAVRSVNNTFPDANGNIRISSVLLAQNLESDASFSNFDTFIQRMSGGVSSVTDGNAWLMKIRGNNIHTGYVEESITPTIEPSTADISVSIDRDTFVSYVEESGTVTLTYTTEWSATLSDYGITVTGTPVNGDKIKIAYVKGEAGTITVANPQHFYSTGWNLYNNTDGYAKVVRYAHGYRVAGAYTALQFSSTLDGTRRTLTVDDGNIQAIDSDGFIWVTGGDATTEIYPAWDDWTSVANEGVHSGYTVSAVNIAAFMTANFPYGLMKAGSTVDEIDFDLGVAYSRVERMENDANGTNLAAAIATGREYEYDENYIYLAKATATSIDCSVSGAYTVNDHGIEYFDSDVPVEAQLLYGTNLKNKLERDTLTISQQALTSAEQRQVHSNLGLNQLYTANISGNGFRLYRIGYVVYCMCNNGSYSVPSNGSYLRDSSNNILPRIPDGYKPVDHVEIWSTLSSKRINLIYDSANGWRFCGPEAFSGINLRFSACWLTQDNVPVQ